MADAASVLRATVDPMAVEKRRVEAKRTVVETVDARRVEVTDPLFDWKVAAPNVETFMLSEVRSFVAALKAVIVQPDAVENTRDLTVR